MKLHQNILIVTAPLSVQDIISKVMKNSHRYSIALVKELKLMYSGLNSNCFYLVKPEIKLES